MWEYCGMARTKEGLEKAAESVDSGAALDVLNQLAA